MNNLIYLNHSVLLQFDNSIKVLNNDYKTYFSIYRRFPFPPGVEYFASRDKQFELTNPWNVQPTEFPLPSLPTAPITFTEAADEFGAEVVKEIKQGKTAYLLWSGGIDSTCVAVSLLKNLEPQLKSQVKLVLNDQSIRENPIFYKKFLSSFETVSIDTFDPANTDLYNSIFLDGEGGDQTFGSSLINQAFNIEPDMMGKPWKSNEDFLHKWLGHPEVPEFWDFMYDNVSESIERNNLPVDNLYGWLHWFNFNNKFDSVMFRGTTHLGSNLNDQDFKYLIKTAFKRLFASTKMQQWTMTAHYSEKFGTRSKMHKAAGKQYIYDFDGNENYYREKRKEFSLPFTVIQSARHFAVDKDYKRYSLYDREVRQTLREKFYPDREGMIDFFNKENNTYQTWLAIVDKK